MPLPITDLAAKGIAGVAIACTAGGGAVVLDAQRDNAVQDTKIETLNIQQTNTLNRVDDVVNEVQETNKKLERLIGRLEGRDGK